jgi:AcrR family transcriptional regulator
MNRTDERVLEAAIRLFAHRGYHGTSIRRITREAGANLGAVTYHFGGKRSLYEAALERAVGPVAERVAACALGQEDALERLAGVMAVFFDYLGERPEVPQLMLQEVVVGRLPPAGALGAIRGVLGAIAGLIEEGQAAGLVGPGDPRLLAVSVLSQPLHLALTARLVVDMDPHEPAARARLLEHARSFVRRGLAPAGVPVGPGESE